MIKQLASKEVEDYIKNNPKSVLLDVRTEEEWNTDGKPDGEKMGLKTYFLSIQFADKSFNQNFIDLKFFNLVKKKKIKVHARSIFMQGLIFINPILSHPGHHATNESIYLEQEKSITEKTVQISH